ncbi:MAG TPA: enoyl-CoA hydratase/isomerase family protein [Pseudonocardia sp.]|jgi:2-(1,2-epoxy-1,2-dihydrophenyl)acetyl-CoA isomerase|nr:enoyl-CoA hydratase/isomerase family protein [Pseudonocardia sp.]
MSELTESQAIGDWETLRCERHGRVALLVLNRPDRLNVMNVAMRDELGDCLLSLRADPEIRALVLTGAGEAFSAGGDVNDFVGRSGEQMHQLMRERSHRWFRALWDLPIPTIAAVNGIAAGGGINLALACDVLLASPVARFGQTFAKVGLIPDLGGLHVLPRSIGLHRAKAMCLTTGLIDAETAREFGLVHRVVEADELIGASIAFAANLADGPREAFAATKAALNRSFELSMEETLQMELYMQSFMFTTDDHRTRLDGFLGRKGSAR